MNEKWYAIYTKPRWEKKVADTLTLQGFEHYCPLNKVVRQWSDRKKTVYVPLFSSYVFVHVMEKQLGELKKVDGVIKVVYWLDKPAVIKDEEINTIRQFLNEYENVQLEKVNFTLHDAVMVTRGSLKDKEGTIVAIKNNHVKVAIPSLGYILYAEIDKSSVAKAQHKAPIQH